MSVMVDPALVAFASRLADVARVETLGRASAIGAVENKSLCDLFDPVTEADREAERVMRELIERQHPDHGVAGEEFEDRQASGPFTWSLDPIDGTRSYMCGLPTWVTLIGLLEQQQPILGVIDVPRLGERYSGDGSSAWLESGGKRQPLGTSNCTQLSAARLSATDPFLFSGETWDAFEALRTSVRTTRYGHDGYAYARLAAGTLDLVVECGLKPHD